MSGEIIMLQTYVALIHRANKKSQIMASCFMIFQAVFLAEKQLMKH